MTSIAISDPQGAMQAQQSANQTDKRNKILIGLGVGLLVLGGVGAALAFTVGKSSSSDSNSSNGVQQDGYARGFMAPPDAQAIIAALPAAFAAAPVLAALPPSVDWRTNPNVVTPVKDQQNCGSCWAFAAAQNMESAYGLRYNRQAILAPQQLVDCDLADGGCNGGWMMTAWTQYHKNNARPYAVTESAYPYRVPAGGAQRSQCRVNDAAGVMMVSGTTNVVNTQTWSQQAEQTVMAHVAQFGPVSVAVSAGGWGGYRSGIATQQSLGCSRNVDHAVMIVGYGDENGRPYWIIRNSWGAGWGDRGYMKLARGDNHCCILCAVMSVNVAATGNAPGPTAAPTSAPPPAPTGNRLNNGQQLQQNQEIKSQDGGKVLKMQTDGNLVLYKNGQAVWASNTIGNGGRLVMQPDCNLVVARFDGVPVWQSNTRSGDAACNQAYLTVQNDGNVVVYRGTTAIWSTNTWDRNTPPAPTSAPNTPTTPRPPAPTNAPNTLRVAYVGCLRDNADRLMPTKLTASITTMLADCAYLAYAQKKEFFGIEWGGECWGANTLPNPNKYGPTDESKCNMPCRADGSKMCGGSWQMNAYKLLTVSQFDPAQLTLPQPPAAYVQQDACKLFAGQPSYCWRCVNNVNPEIACQDVTVTPVDGSYPIVYDGFCPSTPQNATDICLNGF